ncbi:MAG TPA: alpha/beta hydrolase [Gammaproteobacteria bacterium]|nr:alpha/beta hydrolase [Gammaproteobacteria bacterium]
MSSIWVDLMGVEYKQTFYNAGGIRTRALEAGEGPPLILLHGTGGHAEAYVRNLEAHAKHFHVYSIDMLGHGYTDAKECDYTMDDFVDHLVDFLDAIGAEQAYLSGESLGAMVASWTAIKHPQRVIKLVQNTGTLMAPNEKGKAELTDALERSRKAAGKLTREAVRGRLGWLMAEPEKSVTDELIEVRYQVYNRPGMLPVMGKIAMNVLGKVIDDEWCKQWVNPELMRDIQCPTLLLWTRHNPGQPVELAEEGMQFIPNARMVVLENSAHWPQWEEPEPFNKAHLEFLLE